MFNKIKTVASNARNKITVASALMVALVSGSANAALPTALTDMIDGILTDFTALTVILWGAMALTLTFFILLRLTRKGANAAIK